jgi:predicted lipid-binding transport protein (Tim44 family)
MESGWIDVVVFAAIAGFLWLRLRKTLGETNDNAPPPLELPKVFSQKPTDILPQMPAALRGNMAEAWGSMLPNFNIVANATAHQQLGAVFAAHPSFDPIAFLEGAKRALPLIVQAYVAQDNAVLDKLLAPALATEFKAKIASRLALGETYHAQVHHVKKATIAGAQVDSAHIFITGDFISEESITRHNAQGIVINHADGHKQDIYDSWQFVQPISSDTNIWQLHTIFDDIEG